MIMHLELLKYVCIYVLENYQMCTKKHKLCIFAKKNTKICRIKCILPLVLKIQNLL